MITDPPGGSRGLRLDLPTEPYLPVVAPSRTVLRSEVLAMGLALLALPLLVLLREFWPVRPVALVVLLVMPGLMLLRVLRFTGRPAAVLTVPASLVVLLASGLTVTLLGPAVGVDQPLRPLPQLIGVEIVCLVLLAELGRRTRDEGGWSLRPLLSRVPPVGHAVPLLLPVIVIAGAQQLNAGFGALIAVVGVVVGVVMLAGAVVLAPRLSDGQVATALYAVGLGALLSFSMRTEVVYGYDVATEYRKMEQAATSGSWQLLNVNDAYGAMLSVTVLPAQLQQLTGISLQFLVQVVYPALFALVPVIVYFTARKFLDRRWSLVGAAAVAVQGNFGQQLPSLAKQEIGLLLFAATLYVLIVTIRLDVRSYVMLGLLAIGIVVTHYSTAYLTVLMFGIGLVIAGVVSIARKDLRPRVLALLVALATVAGGVAVWNGVLTRSSSNAGIVLSGLTSDGLLFLPNRGANPLLTYLGGTVTPELPAAEYQEVVQRKYATERQFIVPFSDAADPAYNITDVPVRADTTVVSVTSVTSFVLRQIIYIAAFVGALMLLVLRSRDRTIRDSMWLIGALGVGTVLVLALIRVSGSLASSYNQDRALLHALLVLAVGIGWCGQALAKSRLVARAGARLGGALAVGVAVVLAVQLGISSSLPGIASGTSSINLSDTGEDHQRFFVHRAEVLASSWLSERISDREVVYADRYGTLRFVVGAGRINGVFPELVPAVIDNQSWVFVTTTNLETGTVRSETDGKFGLYQFPSAFLGERMDVVYSNGQSQILHR